jgi:hypothetical protein
LPPNTGERTVKKKASPHQYIEFKVDPSKLVQSPAAASDQPLSANGTAIVHQDGRPVMVSEIEAGRTYVIRMPDGLLMPPMNRAARRRQRAR